MLQANPSKDNSTAKANGLPEPEAQTLDSSETGHEGATTSSRATDAAPSEPLLLKEAGDLGQDTGSPISEPLVNLDDLPGLTASSENIGAKSFDSPSDSVGSDAMIRAADAMQALGNAPDITSSTPIPSSPSQTLIAMEEEVSAINIKEAQELLISLKTFIANIQDYSEYQQKQSWLEESFQVLQHTTWDHAQEEVSEILYKWGRVLMDAGKRKEGLLRFWELYEKFPSTRWYHQVFEELVALEKEEDMVFIPGGSFTLVETSQEYQLKPYFLDIYPVTNAKYHEFIHETGYPAPSYWIGDMYPVGKANHPVVWINADDAVAYACWKHKRLPTEMEWENAAKGIQGWQWPWGEQYAANHCNCLQAGIGDTTPVGHYTNGQSPYQVYDLSGNIWEWTDSWYDTKNHRVLRGGSWLTLEQFTTTTYRYFDFSSTKKAIYGFRCCKTFARNK